MSIPNTNITHALDHVTTNLEDQINYLRKEANNLEATARRYVFIKSHFELCIFCYGNRSLRFEINRLRDIANILEIRKNDLDQAIEGK